MTSPIIFGAGLAGLIAARMMLDQDVSIIEKQSSLPNNHHAVLRFRDNEVSTATNIPFKKVKVLKSVHGSLGPIADAMHYSMKVTGGYYSRSITSTEISERYIAPQDFIERLSRPLKGRIEFGVDFEDWSHNLVRNKSPIISTLPMPYMMELFKWKNPPEFTSTPGWTIRGRVNPEIPCDVSCTMYFPGKSFLFYRASITGRDIMVEGVGEVFFNGENANILMDLACKAMGIDPDFVVDIEFKKAKYQKISELTGADRESAKRFIMWLSENHNIYSLGRFAVWRPKLLLDDIPNDVRVIQRLINGNSHYEQRMEQ